MKNGSSNATVTKERSKVSRFLHNLFQHDKRAKSTSDVKEPEVSNLKQRRSSMSGLSLTKQLSSHEIGNKSKSTPSSPNVSTKTVLEVEEEIVQIQVIEVDTRPAAVVDLIDSHAPLERKRSKSEFSRRERSNERRRFSGTDNISKFDLDKTFDETEKPIHEAASKGDLETLKRLIEESPLLSSCVTSKEQNTPLHIACMRNQLEIVQYLVEKNVDANALNKSLCTPLHLACSKGYMPIVEELVTKGNADITQRDGQGNGPFQLCVKFNRFELADYLMSVGSNIDVNSKTEGSKTLLHICGELGNLEAIKYLVERYGSKLNYNMKDNHGKHFLFCVLKGKNVEIIRYLAANVPEVKFNVIMQERGRNLIHQAVEENALPMIKVIHDVKPHLFDVMVNEKDKVKNQSPLHFAVQNNNLEIVSILVQWGANTNIQDSDGNTPLHIALSHYRSKEELVTNPMDENLLYKILDIITKLLEIETTNLDIKNGQKVSAKALLKKKAPALLKNLKTLRKSARVAQSARV